MDFINMPGHLIRRLNQISVALFSERMQQLGMSLTPVQFAVLSGIRSNPGIDQASLAGLVAYDRATLGNVIDRLEVRKLVERAKSSTDRRANILQISAAGQTLLTQAKPHVLALQLEILSGLNQEEQELFLDLLSKITLAGNERSRAPFKLPT